MWLYTHAILPSVNHLLDERLRHPSFYLDVPSSTHSHARETSSLIGWMAADIFV
jgi:hypothetical protein